MKEKNLQTDIFNESFLCNSLNAFEGNSHYFRQINAQFARFLVTYFKHYDIESAASLLAQIKTSPAYSSHPFFPFLISFLLSEKITKQAETNLALALKSYPDYPLAPHLKLLLANKSKKRAQNNDDNFALLINYLKDPLLEDSNLELLSKEGFAFATFRLLLNKLIANDTSFLEPLLLLLAEQNGGNLKEMTSFYLETLLKVYNHRPAIKQVLYRLLVQLGANHYLLPLVDLYEEAGAFSLAFFNLQLGSALNIEAATTRLLAYYKSGKNIPSNAEIIKYLENKLD